MQNLEYRTMRFRIRGAHMGFAWAAHEIRGRATGGGGHGMSNANSGVGHSMSWGDPGCLVLNRK